jgi:hypothetical protein
LDVLGHSAIGVTMNTYTHVVMHEGAADAIGSMQGEQCAALWAAGSATLLTLAWPL